MIGCNRCHDPNPDPTYKFCPDCRAYCRYHNRKSRAKGGPPRENNEVLKSSRRPYGEFPEQGLPCRPAKRKGWFELV